MKYVTLIIGLLVVGCGKQEQADTNESTPTTNTNEVDGTTEKPVKELTLEEKVVGTYEGRLMTRRLVFLENGIVEEHRRGKNDFDESKWSKDDDELKWLISNGEIHIIALGGDGVVLGGVVFSINKDGSITDIASIDKDGKREDIPKEDQHTAKKIK